MALPVVRAKRTRYPAIEDRYEIQETLGAGGFAKVKAGIHKLTGVKVAIKIMDKVQLGDDLPRAAREISILKRLHHQHICQLYEVVETDRMYYLILEYCSGGELFDYIVAKERLKETEARSFFRQIVSAIRYIHSQGFCHRDLKPENLLLDGNSNIKLIDFGLSAEPQTIEAPLGTLCGSPAYAAPELIKGGPYIGPEADAWSMGVLLYALLNGFLPFDDDHTPRLYDLIMKGVYDIPVWLSRDSAKLLAQLLQTDPSRRLKVLDLLNHPWLLKNFDMAVDWGSRINVSNMDDECIAAMSKYYCVTTSEIKEKVNQWEYGPVTSLYLILLKQKLSGKSPSIIVSPLHAKASDVKENGDDQEPSKAVSTSPAPKRKQPSLKGPSPLETSARPAQNLAVVNDKPKDKPPTIKPPIKNGSVADSSEDEIPESPVIPRRKKISVGMPIHPPEGEITNLQIPGNRRVEEIKGKTATSGRKTYHDPLTGSTSLDILTEDISGGLSIQEAKSYDQGMDILHKRRMSHNPKYEKERSQSVQGGATLISKIKAAIRRPSKEQTFAVDQEPRRVKGHFSVSTTSLKPADEVMQELLQVLGNKKITFKRKNYSLRCQEVSSKGRTIQFELEICQFPDMDLVGIRRKRMKGDTWEYKKICDEIFKKAKL
ncbi:maternal embryonic leucine zipper kinase-like [Dysidea avara]|uniref:maternal embryonic leucine zipper kinase-like n=1 Tax=Dysidea avara TaxID=196820 RepID=UPI00331D405B